MCIQLPPLKRRGRTPAGSLASIVSRLSSRISSSSTLDSWFDIRDFTLTFTIAIEFNWIPGWLSCLWRGEFTQSLGHGPEAGPDVRASLRQLLLGVEDGSVGEVGGGRGWQRAFEAGAADREVGVPETGA